MEHGKHARHRRRIQRRPHLIVSFLRLVRRLVPARAVISSRHSVPASRIPVPPGDTRGGAVFLIRSFCSPGSYFSRPAPFSPAHSFRRLVECM